MIAGDIAYNDVHVNVVSTDHAKRRAWSDTLREIRSLQSETVVAMHRRRDRADDAGVVDETITYIDDFDRMLGEGAGARELIEKMLTAHPTRLNITTLYNAAYILAS